MGAVWTRGERCIGGVCWVEIIWAFIKLHEFWLINTKSSAYEDREEYIQTPSVHTSALMMILSSFYASLI